MRASHIWLRKGTAEIRETKLRSCLKRKYSIPSSLDRRSWHHPTLLKSLVYDSTFNVFNRHRILNNTKNTRTFARSWAHPTSELRKVVSFKKPV
jgi:hypothetical protein